MLKLGYIPAQSSASRSSVQPSDGSTQALVTSQSHPWDAQDEESKTTSALYEREVARGFGDNEEVFAGEEEVATSFTPVWANKYRPRKPRYFNRVQMGYEWNKYNQTHYDHDNPPPKVVQGYKFNIFYPDLIDRTKAPTYRIERENGRKRGQSFAPAGEEDTSLIRFIAGPPYEDVAFRIIDKEWDFSAKRDRGFKSSFDKVRTSNSPVPILSCTDSWSCRVFFSCTLDSRRFITENSLSCQVYALLNIPHPYLECIIDEAWLMTSADVQLHQLTIAKIRAELVRYTDTLCMASMCHPKTDTRIALHYRPIVSSLATHVTSTCFRKLHLSTHRVKASFSCLYVLYSYTCWFLGAPL